MSTVDLNEAPLENSFYSDEDTFHKVSTPYMQKKAKSRSKKKWQFLDKTDCLFLNSDNLNQIKLVETCLWNFKNNRTNNFESVFDKKDEKNFLPAEVVLDILSFHNCCTLLTNFYKPSDCEINICIVEDSNEEDLDQMEKIVHEPIDDEELLYKKLVLYYCTICSLYPNLYSANQSSPIESCSSKSDISLSDSDTLDESGGHLRGYMTNFAEDLETTSEGLCDHIREIFCLKRQVFNEYQVKAMKRLLLQKSHPQILKEELLSQRHVIENDLHPCYRKENFQSELCYQIWKNKKIDEIDNMLTKFKHIIYDNDTLRKEKLEKYIQKLTNFPALYQKLVEQIFKNLKNNRSFRLTCNSKRLLKEFQLRYCIDTFEGFITEIKCFIKYFQNNIDIFDILISYFHNLHIFLKMNQVTNEQQKYPILVSNLLDLIEILENINSNIVNILRDLKVFSPDPNSYKIDSLFELMEELAALNEFLNRTSSISINDSIKIHMKIGIEGLYNKTRMSLLENESEVRIDSNFVYSMLIFCREQITYYKNIFFQKCIRNVDVFDLVIDVLYESLMNDVRRLFEEHMDDLQEKFALNMNLLALGYRLKQFDDEHADKISHQKQSWRSLMLPHVHNWIKAIGKISSQMIHRYFIPKERFDEIDFRAENYDQDFLTNLQDLVDSTAYTFFNQMKAFQSEQDLSVSIGTLVSDDGTTRSAFKPYSKSSLSASTNTSIKSNSSSGNKFKKSRFTNTPKSSIDSIQSNFTQELESKSAQNVLAKDRLPCSVSMIDLTILLLRYQHSCEFLLDLFISSNLVKNNKALFQAKFKCINTIYQQMLAFVEVYANNILALDICALNKNLIGKFFGNQIENEVINGKLDRSIWGCRHKLKNSKFGCSYFIDKNSKYLSDNYESVDEKRPKLTLNNESNCGKMCVRLNNLLQLREFHSNIYAGFNKQASRYYNYLIKMSDRNTLPVFQQFKLEIYSLKVTSKNLQNKLDKMYRGLILLLVYRFNMFCKRAIFLLASDHYSQSPINVRIKPLVDFLTDNFKMLKQKLFSKIFLQFVKNLWNSFYHTFVELIDKFEDESAKNPQQQALNYLKIVEIMTTKFKDYTPNHKFLESKMRHIILLLNIYAQHTSTLILLHYKLFNFNYQTKETIEFDRIHLVKIGKKLSKKFSGKFFIKFLKKNPPSQIQSNLINKDYLISYSQRLLESGFLKPIQFEKSCSISKNSKKSALSDSADDSLVLKGFCAENIFLATVTNYYMLDQDKINKLVDNLLFKNSIINQEIEVLFNDVKNLHETIFMKESDELFDKCIKNSIIDHDLIVRILWHRIYQEPLVMKFISMRHSNFANDSYLKKILPNRTSEESFDFEYAIMHLI